MNESELLDAVVKAAGLLAEWMAYGGNQEVRDDTDDFLERWQIVAEDRMTYVVTDQAGKVIGRGADDYSYGAEDAVWRHIQSSPAGVYLGVCRNWRGVECDRATVVLREEQWAFTDVATCSGLWAGGA